MMRKLFTGSILLFCSLLLFQFNVYAEWFRGNTHCHTTNSDGDSTPDEVARWYYENGFNFLVITEHNKFTRPEDVDTQGFSNFILIPGSEISGWHKASQKPIHTTALGIHSQPDWKFKKGATQDVIQTHVDESIRAGGFPILAHPAWKDAVRAEDLLPVEGISLFEIFNEHVDSKGNYYTNSGGKSGEDLWDELLTSGKRIYGVVADDMHKLHQPKGKTGGPANLWISVNANRLDEASIKDAMLKGKFYASSGIVLRKLKVTKNYLTVKVHRIKTAREFHKKHVFGSKMTKGYGKGYTMEFIGPNGEILKRLNKASGRIRLDAEIPYVRCKVTFGRLTSEGLETFHAWTQPVFSTPE